MDSFYSKTLKKELTINRKLGAGGAGITYLVADETGKQYVLKILKLSTTNRWKTVERFHREIEMLKQLNHPNIPKYYDLIETDETLGILQEYIAGDDFRKIISSPRLIKRSVAIGMLKQGIELLTYLSKQNPPVIHRDISPGNLILDKENKLWLVDFGAARWMGGEQNTMTSMGTFGYMAPEQIYGQVSPKSDCYSFGVSLLALLTKTEPGDFPINLNNGYPDFEWGIEKAPPEMQSVLRSITHHGVQNRVIQEGDLKKLFGKSAIKKVVKTDSELIQRSAKAEQSPLSMERIAGVIALIGVGLMIGSLWKFGVVTLLLGGFIYLTGAPAGEDEYRRKKLRRERAIQEIERRKGVTRRITPARNNQVEKGVQKPQKVKGKKRKKGVKMLTSPRTYRRQNRAAILSYIEHKFTGELLLILPDNIHYTVKRGDHFKRKKHQVFLAQDGFDKLILNAESDLAAMRFVQLLNRSFNNKVSAG